MRGPGIASGLYDWLHEQAIVEDVERELDRRAWHDRMAHDALTYYHLGQLSLLQALLIVTKCALDAKDEYQRVATDALAVSDRPIYLGVDPEKRKA